jgi:hypothetical protein
MNPHLDEAAPRRIIAQAEAPIAETALRQDARRGGVVRERLRLQAFRAKAASVNDDKL